MSVARAEQGSDHVDAAQVLSSAQTPPPRSVSLQENGNAVCGVPILEDLRLFVPSIGAL